ncbi:LarC family nickel insertion protein [Dyella solisilvae]|uniref:LarC family nickel insertion protein n=2 Tax=Dyella solisilvae TaxID=1920168 RepID=A0A370K9P9_9GAMM|nr:LarC family nickel insertion protein [Dyella solisilvae]
MAGDMFVAALLDAFPEWEDPVRHAIGGLNLGPDGECRLELHNDGTFVGRRFMVGLPEPSSQRYVPAESSDRAGEANEAASLTFSGPLRAQRVSGVAVSGDGHGHRRWLDIRQLLQDAPLSDAIRKRAVSIFQHLAEAEARVHGVAVEEVTFHEVGAVDTICDIVAASVLIALADADWSVAPLPLGQGRVHSAHGPLPVPAPATALLLEGFATIQDGFPGERVTPTGAAIVRHLCHRQVAPSVPYVLERSGIGFGSRSIAGLSNCVRVLVSREQLASTSSLTHRELAVIEFDIDDQSPEDLSIGLDRIRTLEGIHDVVQFFGVGKKGRSFAHIRILASPVMLERAIEASFAETTTIGLRYHMVSGKALTRSIDSVEVDGHRIRVKCVERPGGQWTAKAEMEDVAHEGDRRKRVRLRSHAESTVLSRLEAGEASRDQGVKGQGDD